MASYGLSLQVLRYVRGGCTGSCVELGADGGKAVVPVEFHSLTVRAQLMAVRWRSDGGSDGGSEFVLVAGLLAV